MTSSNTFKGLNHNTREYNLQQEAESLEIDLHIAEVDLQATFAARMSATSQIAKINEMRARLDAIYTEMDA